MTIRRRLDKLSRRQRAGMVGGVVQVLSDGYRWQGRHYGPDELPPGGYLFVPGEMPPELWNVEAGRVHQVQEAMLQEIGK